MTVLHPLWVQWRTLFAFLSSCGWKICGFLQHGHTQENPLKSTVFAFSFSEQKNVAKV